MPGSDDEDEDDMEDEEEGDEEEEDVMCGGEEVSVRQMVGGQRVGQEAEVSALVQQEK